MRSYFQALAVILLLFMGATSECAAFQYVNTAYNHKEVPASLNQLKVTGSNYYNVGNVEKAIESYLALIEQCFKLGHEKYVVDLYEYIADFITTHEDFSIATKKQKIAAYCNQEDRIDLKAVLYSYWAQAYLIEGIFDTADIYYDKAITYCDDNSMWVVKANLNLSFAFNYYYFNNLKKTLLYTKKAESIVASKIPPEDLSVFYNLYGLQSIIYSNLGYIEKCIESCTKNIALIKQDKSIAPSILADKYFSLALEYNRLGDFDNATLYYNKSIQINNGLEIFYTYYPAYCIISYDEVNGNYKKAKSGYNNLLYNLKLTKSTSEDYYLIVIQTHQSLANIFLEENKLDSAAYYLDQLLKIHTKSSDKEDHTYCLLTRYSTMMGKFEEAETYAKKALFLLKNSTKTSSVSQKPIIYRYLSINSLKKGALKEALSYCQQTLNTLAPTFSNKTLYDNPTFEQVFHKEELIPAINTKLKVLEALYDQKDPNVTPQLILSTIKLGIQGLEYKNKNFKSKSSQKYWLNREAIPLFEKAIAIALHLQEQTGDSKYLNEAFMLSERSKSIMMMNALQEQNATSFGGIPKELIDREQALEREFKVIEKARQDAEMSQNKEEMRYQDSLLFAYNHEKNSLLQRFESDYPKYYELKHIVHQTSIQQVQEALDEQTVLVEYFQGKEKIYVFTLTKEQAFVKSFAHDKRYDVQLASFQNLLIDLESANKDINGSYRLFVKSAHELYQLLLEKSLVPNKKRLMLIPDGQLAYLPFEVLLTERQANLANSKREMLDFGALPYLLRQYATNYNYSAQLFLQQRAQRKKKQPCSILGLAPFYSNKTAPKWRNPYEQQLRKELPALSGAVKELEFLSQSLNLKGSFLYGEAANEANFKAKAAQFNILHLAVHGLVNEEKPELSGLALEEDNNREEDNILYAYEIKQLDLQAQLVVLSACETGIGKYQHGEGVMSIGRGFMYAGVPSLMTTLWNLNDYSSLMITKEFYKNLENGLAKDEALRQAKLSYLDDMQGITTHPALWACFVQVGDYAPLTLQHNYQQWYFLALGLLILVIALVIFMKMRKK